MYLTPCLKSIHLVLTPTCLHKSSKVGFSFRKALKPNNSPPSAIVSSIGLMHSLAHVQ